MFSCTLPSIASERLCSYSPILCNLSQPLPNEQTSLRKRYLEGESWLFPAARNAPPAPRRFSTYFRPEPLLRREDFFAATLPPAWLADLRALGFSRGKKL